MKKVLVSLMWLVPIVLWATISPKYSEGYTFDPTVTSTSEKEYALSPYKDSTFVFIRANEVFVTKIDTAGELDNPQKCADFDLHIGKNMRRYRCLCHSEQI